MTDDTRSARSVLPGDDDAPSQPVTPTRRRGAWLPKLLGVTLAAGVAGAVTFGIGVGVKTWLNTHGDAAVADAGAAASAPTLGASAAIVPPVLVATPRPAGVPAAPTIAAPVAAPVVQPVVQPIARPVVQPVGLRPAFVPAAARVEAAVLVAGERHDARRGRIALPSGTRFQIDLGANRAGRLELYAINPMGVAAGSPLWSAEVGAGQRVRSPLLRLDGVLGLETMQVVLLDAAGSVVAERQVQIWHL